MGRKKFVNIFLFYTNRQFYKREKMTVEFYINKNTNPFSIFRQQLQKIWSSKWFMKNKKSIADTVNKLFY